MPEDALADDVKFRTHVLEQTKAEVQAELDKAISWSDEHDMPLSIEKTVVMHCGQLEPLFTYQINGSYRY